MGRIEVPQRSKTLTDPCQSAILPPWLGGSGCHSIGLEHFPLMLIHNLRVARN